MGHGRSHCGGGAAGNPVPGQLAAHLFRTGPVSCVNRDLDEDFAQSNGCDGGKSDDAMSFMARHALPLGANYPFTSGSFGSNGLCVKRDISTSSNAGMWLMLNGGVSVFEANRDAWGYDNVIYLPLDEDLIADRVVIQPVIVYWAISFDAKMIYQYTRGVLTSGRTKCASYLTDAMVLVGYDKAAGFWVAQRSWGATWGENGFVRLQMTGDYFGLCQMYKNAMAPRVNMFAAVPTVGGG